MPAATRSLRSNVDYRRERGEEEVTTRLRLTPSRKKMIVGFKAIDQRGIERSDGKWQKRLIGHLTEQDAQVKEADVQRWCLKHPWIVQPGVLESPRPGSKTQPPVEQGTVKAVKAIAFPLANSVETAPAPKKKGGRSAKKVPTPDDVEEEELADETVEPAAAKAVKTTKHPFAKPAVTASVAKKKGGRPPKKVPSPAEEDKLVGGLENLQIVEKTSTPVETEKPPLAKVGNKKVAPPKLVLPPKTVRQDSNEEDDEMDDEDGEETIALGPVASEVQQETFEASEEEDEGDSVKANEKVASSSESGSEEQEEEEEAEDEEEGDEDAEVDEDDAEEEEKASSAHDKPETETEDEDGEEEMEDGVEETDAGEEGKAKESVEGQSDSEVEEEEAEMDDAGKEDESGSGEESEMDDAVKEEESGSGEESEMDDAVKEEESGSGEDSEMDDVGKEEQSGEEEEEEVETKKSDVRKDETDDDPASDNGEGEESGSGEEEEDDESGSGEEEEDAESGSGDEEDERNDSEDVTMAEDDELMSFVSARSET